MLWSIPYFRPYFLQIFGRRAGWFKLFRISLKIHLKVTIGLTYNYNGSKIFPADSPPETWACSWQALLTKKTTYSSSKWHHLVDIQNLLWQIRDWAIRQLRSFPLVWDIYKDKSSILILMRIYNGEIKVSVLTFLCPCHPYLLLPLLYWLYVCLWIFFDLLDNIVAIVTVICQCQFERAIPAIYLLLLLTLHKK